MAIFNSYVSSPEGNTSMFSGYSPADDGPEAHSADLERQHVGLGRSVPGIAKYMVQFRPLTVINGITLW